MRFYGKANKSSLLRTVYCIQCAHNVVMLRPLNPNKGQWGELWSIHWSQQNLDPPRSQWYRSLDKITYSMSPGELPRYILSHIATNGCHRRRKANLHAVSCEEDVFVDKKMPIANSTSWWSLMSSVGTLIMLGTIRLPFILTMLPFILRTEHPPSVRSLPKTPPPWNPQWWENYLFEKSSAWVALAICRLLISFRLSLTVCTNPNSTIFFGWQV